MDIEQIKKTIRSIPDFPKKGVVFRDITTLLKDTSAFKAVMDHLHDGFKDIKIDAVLGIESRGFIFGGALADRLGIGFIPARKPGKLPAETISESYDLEYGKATLEIHKDAIKKGGKILIIDDLLATGGTLEAACKLVTRLGGEIAGVWVLIELTFLNGRSKLTGFPVRSLMKYDSE
jgi:adenine phosphoribosyltransferase